MSSPLLTSQPLASQSVTSQPRTSQPKLMTLNAPTVRNQRTLIWLQQQKENKLWSRWDGVVTSLADYHKWVKKSKIVGIILSTCPAEIDTFVDELFSISKSVTMVFLTQEILSKKPLDFWTENFDNLLNLNDLVSSYPFLQSEWGRTDADAVAIFALLHRYYRLVDGVGISDTRMSQMKSVITVENGIIPQQTCVITQFFNHSSKSRYLEIKECLRRNCACPYVDQIVLLNERDYSKEWSNYPGAEKIKQVVIKERLLYSNFLKYVATTVPSNVFAILCNSDIYFGDSLLDLWRINMTDRLLALLRWDDDGTGPETAALFGPRADSQDTWIVLSDSVKSRSWDYKPFQFQLGQAGCDNAFAGHMLKQRFLLSNPALTFKTFHLHNSGVRTYDKKDYIRAPIYINMVPTYIIDTKQEIIPLGAVEHFCNESVEFTVKSSSMSNEITYCTMLEKEGRYKWEPTVENYYFEPAIPVYTWTGANGYGVTTTGLVYDLHTIYMGKHSEEDRFNLWKTSHVDIFTPLQSCKKMLAIPVSDISVFKHPDMYITYYLSYVLRLVALHPDAAYWVPAQLKPYLPRVLGAHMVYDTNTACWADTVIGYLPGPTCSEVGREDVTGLRSIIPWISYPARKICTVILDDILTESVAKEKLFPLLVLQSKGWTLRFVQQTDYGVYDALMGASLCMVYGLPTNKMAAKIWALPKECCLIEFQQELQLSGETQHLAHVSDLRSWVLLLAKGSVQDVQEQMVMQFGKWLKKNVGEIVVA